MLELTTNAAEVIRQLAQSPEMEGLRISATSSENSQSAGLELALAPGPAPEDAVVEAEDARVFLDPPAALALDDKVLDADVQGGEVRFAVREQ